MSTATVIVLIIAIAAIGFAVFMWMEREKSRKLRSRFGPEYERLVDEHRGDHRKAERILEKRQQRVDKYPLRRLTTEEAQRFASQWRQEQQNFVDDPRAAVSAADKLVAEAMRARGFPVGEFDQRVDDISVEHPRVVEHYRAAHDIAVRDARGQASTEDLRVAMQHYRQLFEHLLDQRVNQLEEAHR
jgi:FtsZ-interacting cell division protein ZipA